MTRQTKPERRQKKQTGAAPMKRSFLLWTSFIVVLTALFLHAAEAVNPSEQAQATANILQEILILNSYDPGYAWSDDEQAGIIDVFRAKDKNWFPVIEYLDMKHLPDGRHLAELKKLFRLKYHSKKFSVVIAMDNPALEFAIDNQAELFGNAPIVFCGINNYTPSLLKGRTNVTGIVEAIDIAGTIAVMLRLHPATREIFSPHDYTATGLAVRKELEALVPRFGAKVRFRFTDPLTMEELLKELERLPKDSLVLEIGFITDKSGRTFGISETTKLFYEHSPVPIYSTYEQRLGFGIVGGKLLGARHHGAHAASIALKVLAGEKASAIPVVFESHSRFMFDYKVMNRFGIPLSALPEGSTVINQPVSFYATHRVVIQTALGVIVFMAAVIALLTINIIQRRRSAVALRASKEALSLEHAKLQTILDYSPALISIKDLNGNVILANRNFAVLDAPPLNEFVGKNVFDLFPKEVAENLWNNDQTALKAGGPMESEEIVKHKDGRWHTYLTVKFPVYKETLHPFGTCAISTDITDRKKAEIRLARLKDCFLQFGVSPEDNINRLVAVCGELMNATCALYNRLGKSMLCSVGQWQAPAGFKSEDKPNGHICYDVIQRGEEHPLLVRNLQESPYARTDPNILPYGLQTYLGIVVKWKQVAVGSLCVVYQTDIIPSNDELQLMTIIASAIAIEEDRLRAEEALKESETRYRQLVEYAPAAIYEADLSTGRLLSVNEVLCEYSGYTRDELLALNPLDLMTEESQKLILQRMADYAAGKPVPPAVEYKIRSKSGREFWISTNAKYFYQAGLAVRATVVAYDITERKQAEEALRRAEENFRLSLDDSPLGVRIVTIEGETIYANRATLNIFGYDSIEELRTTPLKKRYTPESYAEFQIRKEKRKRGDYIPSEYDISIVRKDGEVRHLQVFRKEVLWDGEKQFQVIYQDITERKQAELKLLQWQNLMHFIIKHDPNAIAVYDDSLRYVFVSERYLTDYNVKDENIIGKHHYEVFPEMPERWKMVHRRVLGGAIERAEEDYFERLDGSIDYNRWECRPWYNPDGAVGGMITYTEVITDRKRAEEALRASREQMRALAGRLQTVREEEQTRIAREIHDELGGALTGLKIDFSLLTRAALKIKNETVKTSLLAGMDSMIESIDATIHTVRRIAMELRPGVLDDLGLAAALEWQLKDFEKRTGIRCEFFPPVEDISLDADLSTALFRIFQEAMTNVARHSGATEVCVRLHADADSTTLEVADNGKGIGKKKTLSKESLGLLGMRERAQMFGGRVTVTGTPGRGTTVTVEISPVKKRQRDRDQEGDAG